MLCLTLLMSGFSVGMVTHKSVVINRRQLTEVVRCDQLECDRNMAVNSIQPRNVDFSANIFRNRKSKCVQPRYNFFKIFDIELFRSQDRARSCSNCQ
jgi:hypothetical protein